MGGGDGEGRVEEVGVRAGIAIGWQIPNWSLMRREGIVKDFRMKGDAWA